MIPTRIFFQIDYFFTVVVIHIWNHEFCTRQMGPVRSNLIESLYVVTFTLNQAQQLKSNILVKSVRGMFVQIRTLSYVLIAKSGRMLNVSDLPITQFKHNLDNPHIDWICNWCCLPFCNHFDLGSRKRICKYFANRWTKAAEQSLLSWEQ